MEMLTQLEQKKKEKKKNPSVEFGQEKSLAVCLKIAKTFKQNFFTGN